MKSTLIERLNRVIWAILLLALPFTSHPLVAKLFHSQMVSPLSALPLIFLLFTLLLPTIFRNKTLPRQVLPLAFFALSAIISTAAGSFIELPSFREVNPISNNLEGILTLLVGICFYLTTIYIVRNDTELKKSLVWIYVGGAILIVVSMAQLVIYKVFGYYPNVLYQVQGLFSTSAKLYDKRATGFAFEPSWLAHQLNMLYLPIWLGLSVSRYSISNFRFFRKLSIENLLLIGGSLALFGSFSRIGWLTTGILLAVLFLRKANQWRKQMLNKRYHGKHRIIVSTTYWFAILVIIVGTGLLAIKLMSILDPKRMARVFDLAKFQTEGLLAWANQLEFAERFIYWKTALLTFFEHPFLGVGLGNIGFFFAAFLPSFGYQSPEIMVQLIKNDAVVNAKNLWVRLLSETGAIGFACFIAWLYEQANIVRGLLLEKSDQTKQAFGMVGLLAIIAFILEGLSMDTFGLPYYWISFGLVLSVSRFQNSKEH